MRCVVPFVTQIFLAGILLFYCERLDGFILPCPASNINCKRNANFPSYDNVHIQETIGNFVEFIRSSILKLWSRLIKSNPHEYLDEMGSHENLLEKLYKSSNVLQVTPKAEITWGKRKSHQLAIQKEVTTEISESLEVNTGLKVILKEKRKENKEETHELELQTEVPTEISEVLKVKKLQKWTRKEKLSGNKEKIYDLDIPKEVPTETSEALNIKRWQKVTLKDIIRGNKEKTNELGIQKELLTEISETLKVKRWPKMTLKEIIRGNKEKTNELEIQKELPTRIAEASGHIFLGIQGLLECLRIHEKMINNDHQLREKDFFVQLLTKSPRCAKIIGKAVDEQGKRLPQASAHSLEKRSILQFPTQLSPLTSSYVVNGGGEEKPNKVVFILKSDNRSSRPSHVKHLVTSEQVKEKTTQNKQIAEKLLEKELESQDSRKANLLKHLIIGVRNSRITTEEPATLNKLLFPDKTLSNEAHWEYQEQTTSDPFLSDFLSITDKFFLQGDVFEAEVQKQLAHLILNEPRRNLIAHLIRMIKVNCREPTTQTSCDFLISRIGLVMKLFSKRKNIQEASALLKSDLLLTKNETNMTIPSSRKMEKPSEIPKQGIRPYGNGFNWRLAISVTTTMVVIIVIICLIEICCHPTAKGTEGIPPVKRTFLYRQKEDTPEKQTSVSSLDKPPWLKDMYLDKVWKKYSTDKSHNEESSEEEVIFSRESTRCPEIPEPLPVEITEIMPPPPPATIEPPAPTKDLAPAPAPATATAPAPAPAPPPAPPPAPTPAPAPAPEPVKKASSKKLSEKETSASETSPTTESEKETPTTETTTKTEASEEEGTEATSKKTSSEEGDEDEED